MTSTDRVIAVIGAASPSAGELFASLLSGEARVVLSRDAASVGEDCRAAVVVVVVDGPPLAAGALDGFEALAAVVRVSGRRDRFAAEAAYVEGSGRRWVEGGSGRATTSTADFAAILLLGLVRRVFEGHAAVAAGTWPADPHLLRHEVPHLADVTVGLVGFGRIGQAVAARIRGFGVETLYWSRTRRPEDVETALGSRFADLDELLARSDVVSLHVRTPPGAVLADARFFASMRNGAYFVNTARADAVDEEALREAVLAGRLAGAALDVHAEEPTAGTRWSDLVDRVVLTPHVAGYTARDASIFVEPACAMAVQELRRVSADERRTP